MQAMKWHGDCRGCGCGDCNGTGKVSAGKAPKAPKAPKGCAHCGAPILYGGGLCKPCAKSLGTW